MNESSNKIAITVIFLIIVISGITARLYKIDSPPADHQEWRQCDTASMARNFYRNGTSILYPQIDWGGKNGGYVESEFPLFPYAVSIIYRVTGIDFKFGRIFSVILFPFSALLIFLITEIMYDRTAGITSLFVFTFSPLSVYYSRTFMPESLLLFFILLAFYLILRWRETGRNYCLYLSSAIFSFALLVKALVLFLLPVLLLIIIDTDKKKKKTIKDITIFSILSLIAPFFWYLHAYLIFMETGTTFGIFSGGFLKFGTAVDWANWEFYEKLFSRIFILLLTPFGFILFLTGLPAKDEQKDNRFLYLWLLLLPLITLSVSKGFYAHDYYLISFLPVFSIIAGKSIIPLKSNLEKLKVKSIFTVLLFASSILLSSYYALDKNMYIDGGLYKINRKLINMGTFIEKNSGANDLVAIAGTTDVTPLPSLFYLSDRRGWYMNKNDLKTIRDIEKLKDEGSSLIATMEADEFPVIKGYEKSPEIHQFTFIKESENVIILKLR